MLGQGQGNLEAVPGFGIGILKRLEEGIHSVPCPGFIQCKLMRGSTTHLQHQAAFGNGPVAVHAKLSDAWIALVNSDC